MVAHADVQVDITFARQFRAISRKNCILIKRQRLALCCQIYMILNLVVSMSILSLLYQYAAGSQGGCN